MHSEQKLLDGRTCTVATRTKAVERVIMSMREQLDHPFSLQEMAEIAVMSPFHFDRVFRDVAGVPPRLFLGALRLERAKQLLLTTSLNVVDVCFDVGYESLGTFTTRFTEFVGLSPTKFRRMATHAGQPAFASPDENELNYLQPNVRKIALAGHISAPAGFEGLIFVGLFPLSVPQARPVGGDLLSSPGEYRIPHLPDGHYYVMAAALNKTDNPLARLLCTNALRGKAGPVLVQNGISSGRTDLTLREARLTDPPIVIALPFLLAQRLAAGNTIASKVSARSVARMAAAVGS